MGIQPDLLVRLLVAALICGAALGGLYDVVRISRVMLGMSRYTGAACAPVLRSPFCKNSAPKGKKMPLRVMRSVLLVVQDFVFCLTVGITTALLLFSHNSGEFRGFVLLGLGIGFAVYHFTVGRWVIRASEYVVFAIKAAFLYAVYYLTWPFITLGRRAYVGIDRTVKKQCQKSREKAIRRYTERCGQKLMAAAQQGFLKKEQREK